MSEERFVPVARVTDIPPGQTKIVVAGGKQLAIANVDGNFHAVDNACPHFGGPMGLGKLNGSSLSCPWHGWTFDVKTGENVHSPQLALTCFAVKIENDEVLVRL